MIDGSDPIAGPWSVHEGRVYRTQVDREFEQLFSDGEMLVEARWPNRSFTDQLWNRDRWATADAGSRYGKMVDADLAATGIDWTGGLAVLNVAHQFFTWTRPIVRHAAGSDTFEYQQDLAGITRYASETRPWEDDRYYLVGKLEALDAPGEWHLDRETLTLYLWLPDGSDPTVRQGKKRPEMIAKFTIDGIPSLAALERGKGTGADDPTVGMWEFLNTDRWIMLGTAPRGRRDVVVPLRRTPKYEAMLPQIVEMAEAGAGIDLISRALGIGAEVVRDALHLHETGQRPPGRVDGRRRQRRQSGQPFEPKYRQIAVEVDRRRKAGEGFDRLAREMKVSRGTVLRAYDFANRDEAAAAAREGRKPTRPPYKWSDESRAAKRKSRGA